MRWTFVGGRDVYFDYEHDPAAFMEMRILSARRNGVDFKDPVEATTLFQSEVALCQDKNAKLASLEQSLPGVVVSFSVDKSDKISYIADDPSKQALVDTALSSLP